MRGLMTMTRRPDDWTSSSFDRGQGCLEWRYDGDRVHLRHAGHAEEGMLTLSLAQWQSFIAAARVGQTGSGAY